MKKEFYNLTQQISSMLEDFVYENEELLEELLSNEDDNVNDILCDFDIASDNLNDILSYYTMKEKD